MKTENWKKVRLGDILLIQKKSKIKASDGIENGIYPFFTCSNDIVRTYNSAQYKGPALIFGTGGKASVHFCDTEFSTSTDCLTYYPVSSEINLDLVNQYIQSNIYLLENGFKGAGLKHVSRDYIANIEINLPDIKTQDYIVQKLNKAKNIISNSKKLLTKYDLLIKSRFIEMFGDPVLNPMGWDKIELGKACKEVRYGTSKPAIENGKYTYLRMNNITYEGELDLTNIKTIDISDDELAKCSVKKGDILFNRTNSIDLCGKTCLFKLHETMVIAGYIIRVRVNEKLNPQYVVTFFNTKSIKKMLREMAKGAVNQANINAQEMQAIKIPLPPIEQQTAFAAFVQQIDKSKFTVQKSLEKAETLYKSLMQEYFA